jgi:hypothetical protein
VSGAEGGQLQDCGKSTGERGFITPTIQDHGDETLDEGIAPQPNLESNTLCKGSLTLNSPRANPYVALVVSILRFEAATPQGSQGNQSRVGCEETQDLTIWNAKWCGSLLAT